MKYRQIYLLFAFCVGFFSASAQVNETTNFIKILGQSTKTMESKGIVLNFTLSEIPPNEYKQVRYKPIEQVRQDLETFLATKKLGSQKLVEDKLKGIRQNNYNKTVSKHFKIYLDNEEQLISFSEALIEGLKINDFDYVFDEFPEDIDYELAILALEEAKVKAEKLAKYAGKRLGPIINIEDSTASSKFVKTSSKKDGKTISYKVVVTFEMK